MTGKPPDGEVGAADLLNQSAPLSAAYTRSANTTTGPEPPSLRALPGAWRSRDRRIRHGLRGLRRAPAAGGRHQGARRDGAGRGCRRLPARSAKPGRGFSHRGILTVFDVGVENGRCFIVSDLLDGEPLHEWMKGKVVSWRQTVEIIAGVADALGHAHERAVVHRDVKPGNIILTRDRDPYWSTSGWRSPTRRSPPSWACSRHPVVHVARAGRGQGPSHRRPYRHLQPRCALYGMICNRMPFRSKALPELIRQIKEDDPQPPRQLVPNLPVELERICLKAMAKLAGDRLRPPPTSPRSCGSSSGAPCRLVHGARRNGRSKPQRLVSAPAPKCTAAPLLPGGQLGIGRPGRRSGTSTTWPSRTPPSDGLRRYRRPVRRHDPARRQPHHRRLLRLSDGAGGRRRRALHAALDIRTLTRAEVPRTPATAQRCWLSVQPAPSSSTGR